MICSYSKEFSASAFTDVENVFICEYLPIVSGDAVKVYLYGLYLCKNPQRCASEEDFASALNLSQEQIVEIFKLWEEFGIVTVDSESPLKITYLPVKSAYTGKVRKFKPEKYSEFTKGLQSLLPSRMISTSEYTEYFNIMETFGIKPDAMLMIINSCVDRKGDGITYRYVSKVAKDYGQRGILTVEDVEKEVSSYVLRSGFISKILSAMHLKRQPEIEDSNLYKKWTSELGFENDSILFAAKQLKRGNVEKLDKFLLELYSAKCFSPEEIKSFVEKRNETYDLAVKINRALSIYVEVLEPEIDSYLNKWLSYGYDEQSLLLIAHRCFKQGKASLEEMDKLIEYLNTRGFIGLTSVGDYFESIRKTDELISKILLNAGVNRRPNDWDRENLANWKNWNFSDEMILEAAKLASGKSGSPIAYMNGILSNWKNAGIYSLDNLNGNAPTSNAVEDYNLEYEKRRRKAISLAESNLEKAMAIDGYKQVYSRLLSLERDLALAEVKDDKQSFDKYSLEKENLLEKQKELLASINLTPESLVPQFACKKCNDTGYLGSERCDCYKK